MAQEPIEQRDSRVLPLDPLTLGTVHSPPLAKRPALGRNVIALGVVSLLTDASSEMIYPLLPVFLTSVLGAGAMAVGMIEGAAESAAALLRLASGWWSDRVRRRKPLVVLGYALASATRPLIAIARSANQVLAVRVVDRVGKGIRGAPRDALIADSVDPSIRGRAFGFHRAFDHAGAVIGPLIAFALLGSVGLSLRQVFWIAAIPGALSVIVLLLWVRDVPRGGIRERRDDLPEPATPFGVRFWGYLAVVFTFTLGNSSDAFLVLRATELGVPVPMIPILWAMLHVVKTGASAPGGALSDRIGRSPVIIGGWAVYALVYLGFALASAQWHAWVLFTVYGIYFGLVEGTERALVADLVSPARRGTAFGWYNLAVGLGALPASVIFGAIWDRAGAPTAFRFGAVMAFAAAVGLVVVLSMRPRRA